jgi:hypothetical protein
MPPFQRVFAVEIDLCVVGIQRAVDTWQKNYGTLPLILWVHADDYALANSIVDRAFRHLTVLVDPNYAIDCWSVGSRTDRGFGSVGA